MSNIAIIYNELKSLDKKVSSLLPKIEKLSTREIPVYEIANRLGLNSKKVLHLIEEGLLQAQLVENKKSKSGYSYKASQLDIEAFKELQDTILTERITSRKNTSSKQIVKSIVNNFHKTRKAI